MGIIAAIAACTAIILSCSRKANAQAVTSPEVIAEEEENTIEGPGDSITSFRYESFTGKSFFDSEVYSLSLSEFGVQTGGYFVENPGIGLNPFVELRRQGDDPQQEHDPNRIVYRVHDGRAS